MEGLSGKVAIVTGASTGIGRAIAQRLASEGVRLMLADVSEHVNVLATEHAEAESYVGDLSDETTVRAMVARAVARFGTIDILINNAGGGVIRPFLEHTAESLRETIDRNLWTTLWCCHAVLPVMLKHEQGRIINIGADSVRNGLPEHAAYNAAKGGVHALTTGLAREFARKKITINTVAPCMAATPMVQKLLAEGSRWIKQFADVIPMGRPGEMSEVASMVAYLASDEAAFITGQVISVNGGSTML
ncbi:MAG: SDR family oxidoreductase [Gammaproteobacteria bacterium]|nr:SDR family oxidoreductase [Gammaproteobacteria bacterium]